jgi:fatty acid desaturase
MSDDKGSLLLGLFLMIWWLIGAGFSLLAFVLTWGFLALLIYGAGMLLGLWGGA